MPFAQGTQRLERYFWAICGARIAPVYRLFYKVSGTPVFGDGTRIVWRAQGARVWVEPAPPRSALARLIAASKTLPRR